MSDNRLALVLAGHGDITPTNAAALLDNYMPEEISPFAVERVTRAQKGLRTAIKWFEDEGLEVARVADPVAQLQDYLQNRKDDTWDVALVILHDPEDPEDTALVAEAHAAGIPVKNLAAAYDEIVPAEPDVTDAIDEVEATEPKTVQDLIDLGNANFTPQEVRFLKHFVKSMLPLAHGLAEHQVKSETTPRPVAPEDDPPFDGPYITVGSETKKPGTTAFLMSEDGNYRLAEGHRKKNSETKVWLTDEEIAELPREVYDPE